MGGLSKSIRALFVILVAVLIAGILFITKTKPEKIERQEMAPLAEVMVAEPSTIVMKVETFGTVKPRKSVKITAEVPGRIEYINPLFKQGGFLKKGELILRIDPRSYKFNSDACRIRIRQAKADISRLKQEIRNLKSDLILAENNLKLSTKELNRISKLARGSYASKNMLDSVEMAHLKATMQVQEINNRLALTDSIMEQKQSILKMAMVELEKADLALEKTDIKADFEGYVMDKLIEEGEYVRTGQILGRIYLKSELDVNISIPLEKMKWLDPVMENGMVPEVEIRMAGSSGDGTRVWHGKVARVNANIDEKTRTLPMIIEIDGGNNGGTALHGLRPGTFVKCSIQGQEYNNIFILPRYIFRGTTLFLVKDNQLSSREVTILRKFEDKVYVNTGLNKGDKILAIPIPGAREGMRVKLKSQPRG